MNNCARFVMVGMYLSVSVFGAGPIPFGFSSEGCFGFLSEMKKAPDAKPTDDLVDIFADYLEDNGDSARAELIRIDTELAEIEGSGNSERLSKLRARRDELITQNSSRWVPKGTHTPVFEKGLLREVSVSRPTLAPIDLDKMEELLKNNPTIRFVFLPRANVDPQPARDAIRKTGILHLGKNDRDKSSSPNDSGFINAMRSGDNLTIMARVDDVPGERTIYGVYDSQGELLKLYQIPRGHLFMHHEINGLPDEFSIRVVGGG